MRVATLQFSPLVGKTAFNFEQAESLLVDAERDGRLKDLDILVLPEMAFSGYNFTSLAHITPFLEPTAAGPSTQWAIRTAKRLDCIVAVGYPEICAELATPCGSKADSTRNGNNDHLIGEDKSTPYNSLVLVDARGDVIAHYRKTFLYYTDDSWAKEGPEGFYQGTLPLGPGNEMVNVAMGICMDINPYKFQAPMTAYEFASHCQQCNAKVIIVSMAWLTRLSHTEVYGIEGNSSENIRKLPDLETIGCWIERFRPLLLTSSDEAEVIVVISNRAGEEGEAPIIGDVRYAGSSCVMGLNKANVEGETNVRIWDMMGRGMNGILVIDTTQPHLYAVQKQATDEPSDEDEKDVDPDEDPACL